MTAQVAIATGLAAGEPSEILTERIVGLAFDADPGKVPDLSAGLG